MSLQSTVRSSPNRTRNKRCICAMPRRGRGATVAPVPGRTRPIGLGADDERSYQEDREPRGGTPGGHGGGLEEALPGGAALATTERCEAAEARPQGRPSATKAAAHS